ncbi:hypothetical protein MHU86_1790 [Fragilaria crotonensis]|nr:hypothetical protein MHU86_1790 [Fragilaria crotonensis]
MSDKGIHTVLFRAVMLLRADDTYGPRMSNCWLPAAIWVEAIRKSGHIDASLIIDVREFNTAMSKSSLFGELMTRFDGSNATGVFRINYQHQYFYYFTDDRPTGKTKVVERSKKVLLEALKDKGVTPLQQQRRYTKKELQDFARNNGIDVVDVKEQIAPGWEGKPKGLLQVLGERGLIDRASLEQYTLEGRKDAITGIVDLRYSLRHLLAECYDFKEEETALQFLGSQLGW